MGRGRARAHEHGITEANGGVNHGPPPPTAERDDGSAVWDLDPFVISAHPAAGIDHALVVLDGQATSPDAALVLADALRAAALRAELGPNGR